MARSRFSLTVSSPGAARSSRAWWSPIPGVLPSPLSAFGRLTPLTGLWLTAFFSQRYSNRDESAAKRCRTVPPLSTVRARLFLGVVMDLAPDQVAAPGDDMRPGHDAE